MPQSTHIDSSRAEEQERAETAEAGATPDETRALRERAEYISLNLAWLPNTPISESFIDRCQTMAGALKPILAKVESRKAEASPSDDMRWLSDNNRLLYSAI